MIFTRKFFKICAIFILFLTIFQLIYVYSDKSRIDGIFLTKLKSEKLTKVSWEDINFINYEKTRIGPGEHGIEVIVTDPEELRKNKEWLAKEGFFVEVSNKISLTRALPDRRPKVCENQTYFQNLPNVSIIVTFHNEILSTLLRCIHSIYNRSPKILLLEIVLVNDKSTSMELYDPLRQYVKEFFGSKVKLVENKERQGLIKARMTGAKAAKGEVIIFLDSHMEVFNSWLPPLLDPLVMQPNFATVPVTDGMHGHTFKPVHTGYGYRGMFDWNFRYQWLPLRPQDRTVEGAPYELPAMTGGAYAIRRERFFHLGGYDEELLIWNGENYEISLKLWLCSGGILEIPCSRVAHLSKSHSAYRETEKPIDFIGRNLKRVAEVWLDEYKEYFYRGDIHRYEKLDPGDLTKQLEKKKSLKCKPFKHYLEVVAPDMLLYYPIFPHHFAAGQIKTFASSRCVGMPDYSYQTPVALVDCKSKRGVDFILTLEKSIRYNDTNDQCLNADDLKWSNCHHQGGSQYFKFDLQTRQIRNPSSQRCLSADGKKNTVFLTTCDVGREDQKWKWTYENSTALMDWENTGIRIK